MLAQNFRNAASLGLQDDERDALITTLLMLETEKLTHVKVPRGGEDLPGGAYDMQRELEYTGHFNMDHWRAAYGCKTVCCIGGTAELVGNVQLVHSAERNQGLYELFYPMLPKGRWKSITVSQAARALRNYLTNGWPDWQLAMDRK